MLNYLITARSLFLILSMFTVDTNTRLELSALEQDIPKTGIGSAQGHNSEYKATAPTVTLWFMYKTDKTDIW